MQFREPTFEFSSHKRWRLETDCEFRDLNDSLKMIEFRFLWNEPLIIFGYLQFKLGNIAIFSKECCLLSEVTVEFDQMNTVKL